jgi:hypothetical protein
LVVAANYKVDQDIVARVESDPKPLVVVDGPESFDHRETCFLFDKRPEFTQLALFEVIILDQLLAYLLAMAGCLLKDERYRVLADVKDP